MSGKPCAHLGDSLSDLTEIWNVLSSKDEIKCCDCDCPGPNLWLCLKKNCSHIGCAEKSNDHSTIHNAKDPSHCIHMNLSTKRVWCYECKWEVFFEQKRSQHLPNGGQNYYDSDQEEGGNVRLNKDSGHGSYSTLRANSPERGAIFENSVGLNVGMSGDGDASDSSDIGDYGDYSIDTSNHGLMGLQNIGNTCYMNAALQALSNTEPLTRYFIDCDQVVDILSEGKRPGLSRTYQALIKDMWVKKISQGYVTPSGILYGIRNVHAMFRGYHQHDTQEFLRNFMDQLHEELKQPVAPEFSGLNDSDSFSLAMEEPSGGALSSNYDSSEGEYETCDSGVSERSSLSDDSEAAAPQGVAKRRLSRCASPGRRQRPRVQGQAQVIDGQPGANSLQPNQSKRQTKYRSIISDIFDGKLLSSVQCLTCDRVSSRIETFQDLSLPIPSRDHLVLLHGRTAPVFPPNATCSDAVLPVQDGWISWILAWIRSWWYGPVVTLHDCLSAFFSTDELKGDNMYSCEKCNKLRNGIKFSKVLQLPEVLCIHLKRFRHELMYSSKISSAISFPLKGLDMWPYLHANNTSRVSNYELFSVICHHGTAGGGHYTSYALNAGQWYEFDDQYVTKVPAERVQNCEAYVLFYRKVQTSAEEMRRRVDKMVEDADKSEVEIRRAHIGRQWLNRFYFCVESGPIDNTDFLCPHGAFDPDKELILDQLSIEIPFDTYEYLHKRYGGCPPIANPVICPACTALQQRIVNEMETFLEISRKAHSDNPPHTHYLSTSWYVQWHAFVQKKTTEPPGPIDNTRINPSNVDTDEAADVPQCIWDFFYNIYGGGPVIRMEIEAEHEGEEEEESGLDREKEGEVSVGEGRGDAGDVVSENIEMMETENSEKDFPINGTSEKPKEPSQMETEERKTEDNEVKTDGKQKNQSPRRGGRYRRRNH